MGSLRSRAVKPGASDKAAVTSPNANPSVTALQNWLVQVGVLDKSAANGVYGPKTHSAVRDLANKLVGQGDPKSVKLLAILNEGILNHEEGEIRKNVSYIESAWFNILSYFRTQAQTKEEDKKPTYNYAIVYDGATIQLPLSLVYKGGAPMYSAILEQNSLFDPDAQSKDQIVQLNKAFKAIMGSLSEESDSNMRNIIVEADRALRQSLRATEPESTESLAYFLGTLVPEFNKISDQEKSAIVALLYQRFYPYSSKFIEMPPTRNSRILNMAEYTRNQYSIAEVVANKLREMGYKK